jgi:hypothetical protein
MLGKNYNLISFIKGCVHFENQNIINIGHM